jgi:hypothetical protein
MSGYIERNRNMKITAINYVLEQTHGCKNRNIHRKIYDREAGGRKYEKLEH